MDQLEGGCGFVGPVRGENFIVTNVLIPCREGTIA